MLNDVSVDCSVTAKCFLHIVEVWFHGGRGPWPYFVQNNPLKFCINSFPAYC